MSLDPSVLGISKDWCSAPGVEKQLQTAAPLWPQTSDDWRVGSARVEDNDVPQPARRPMASMLDHQAPSWRMRCPCGSSESAVVGDAVAALVCSDLGTCIVDVAFGSDVYKRSTHVFFFRVRVILELQCGQAAAVVLPFRVASNGVDYHLEENVPLFLPKNTGVRRAVALRVCDGLCAMGNSEGIARSEMIVWRLMGRRSGYPSRSA